ncbi:biopolymer transporter ExbD [uncultured Kordia sp.]|uniref:ExbD/TolR family protein n=1 Tax=uncultured Kordia sp. TaxID=507699 RepID=UPI00262A6414|nr:biopolymer transporter ExbD [uncultured Kordia sp.]
MKIYITLITLFLVSFSIAQKNIEIPTFETVKIHPDPLNSVSIAVTKTGDIFFEREKIKLNKLRAKMFHLLYTDIKNNTGISPSFVTELVIDKDISYTKILPVLNALRKMDVRYVFFACNSNSDKRVFKRKITGFSYKLARHKNPNSLIDKVFKQLSAKDDDDIKSIPPPPPPPELAPQFFKEKSQKIKTKIINVNHQSYTIDNQEMSATELAKKLMEWNSKEKVFYLLQVSENCTYEDVVIPIAQLHIVLKKIRNKESIRIYGKEFSALGVEEEFELQNAIPFRMIIEK